jgi:hypothetical protein
MSADTAHPKLAGAQIQQTVTSPTVTSLSPLVAVFPFVLYLAINDDSTGLEIVPAPAVVTAMCILGCARFSMLIDQIDVARELRRSRATAPSPAVQPVCVDMSLPTTFSTGVKYFLVEAQLLLIPLLISWPFHICAFYGDFGTTSTLVSCAYFFSLMPVVALSRRICPHIWYWLHNNAVVSLLFVLLAFQANCAVAGAKEQALACADVCGVFPGRGDGYLDRHTGICLLTCFPARYGSLFYLFAVVVVVCAVSMALEFNKYTSPPRRPVQSGAVHAFVMETSISDIIVILFGVNFFFCVFVSSLCAGPRRP